MKEHTITVRVTTPNKVSKAKAAKMLSRLIDEGIESAGQTLLQVQTEEWDDPEVKVICKSKFEVQPVE